MQKDPLKAQQTTARELLEIGAQRIAHTLADAPESRISVLHMLGEMHWVLGLREEAVRLKLDALTTAREAFGELDLRLARAAVEAVRSLEDTPRRQEIPALLEAADAAFVAAGDEGIRERPAVLMMLSRHYRHESLPDSVRAGEAAVVAQARVDADTPELINAYRAAGRARIVASDFDLAEAHQRAAVRLSDRQGEGRATWLVNARAELAEVLFKQGRFEAAEIESRAAVDLSLRAHGPAHRWTLIVRIRLANQLFKTGEVADALAHLAAVEHALAQDRPEYDAQFRADIGSHLAVSLADRGRPDLAEALVRADLDDLLLWFPNSSAVAARRADLALVLAALGRLDEALALAEAAHALWQRYAGELATTAMNALYLTALSTVHRLAGRTEQAWALFSHWTGPTSPLRGRWLEVVALCTIERLEVAQALGRFAQVHAEADAELPRAARAGWPAAPAASGGPVAAAPRSSRPGDRRPRSSSTRPRRCAVAAPAARRRGQPVAGTVAPGACRMCRVGGSARTGRGGDDRGRRHSSPARSGLTEPVAMAGFPGRVRPSR
jgi:serine/threonine-protein kinase